LDRIEKDSIKALKKSSDQEGDEGQSTLKAMKFIQELEMGYPNDATEKVTPYSNEGQSI
jgi:hypothetical protein